MVGGQRPKSIRPSVKGAPPTADAIVGSVQTERMQISHDHLQLVGVKPPRTFLMVLGLYGGTSVFDA